MTTDPDSIGIPKQARASTGVAGLDDILGGEVGQALTDFEGVLTGVTSYRGKLPLLNESSADPP